jgi:diguanylate cyclase (GGDEF)-like protein
LLDNTDEYKAWPFSGPCLILLDPVRQQLAVEVACPALAGALPAQLGTGKNGLRASSKANTGMHQNNQRAHIRHPVSMAAELLLEGEGRLHCRIADFCLGGVLVRFADQDPSGSGRHPLSVGQSVALTLVVDGSRGQRELRLPARAARTLEGGVGLQFVDPDPTDLLALQNHVRAQRESTEAPAAGTASSRVDPGSVLAPVRDELRSALEGCLEAFFPRVRDALTESADQEVTNEQQHPWFAAINALANSGETVNRQFLQAVSGPMDSLFAGATPDQAMDFSLEEHQENRLSLVDKEMFEDWLTLKVMASRAEGNFHEQLLPLQLRFDDLLNTSLTARQNPLHPAVICSAFGQAIKPLGLSKPVERRILEVFDDAVVTELGVIYERINNTLARAGVLPDLDVARYLSEHYSVHTGAQDEPEAANNGEEPDAGAGAREAREPGDPARDAPGGRDPDPVPADSVVGGGQATRSSPATEFADQQARANQAYETVRRIMEHARGATAVTAQAASEETANQVAPSEVVSDALARLQRDAGPETENMPLQERVHQAVAGEMNDAEAQPLLDDEVAQATDIIHHLFEGIAESDALSDRVRSAVKRLKVPFLRLLLQDEAVLQQDEHPARQMLNRIAQLGVRGNARLQDHEDAIDRNVDRVVQDFSGDISVFSDTLEKLDELCDTQAKSQQRNLQRITEAYDGQHKVVEARREVDRALERRIGGAPVPQAVLTLIEAGWRQLLLQTLLREGQDSDAWHEYLGVLDRMNTAAENMPDQEQLSRLLASIKEGLARVDESQLQNKDLVAELRRLLSVKIRQRDGAPPMAEMPKGMLETPQAPAEEELDERQRRWRARALRYQQGDWFRFHGASDEHQHVCLAWVAPDQRLFVLVNHEGMKIQELSLDDFAEHLRTLWLEPIDSLDAPAVDRGLEAMVQRLYNQMAHQATHDELTGLRNRRELERRVRERLEAGVEDASLVQLDVDQFKVINNTAGPDAGDQVLQALAEMIEEAFPEALTARLGGNEFALWLEDVRPDAAERVVENFKDRIEQQRFSPGGPVQALTLSCGLVDRQGAVATVGSLMQAADAACQSAKEEGGNRVHRYQADDETMASRGDVMEQAARLTEALDEDKLQLRCQRIEPTEKGDHRPAYEVLIALRGDGGELVSPVELVQAAERYNRIHAVDRWVITHVLRWMHERPGLVRDLDHISINLSGHSLNDPGLTEFLFEQFRLYPVPRDRVCFEVTETTAITNLEDAADFIEALQDLGCRFSLDDFGSGLSSYGYLKHLPVDYIKIDGSFIRDIAEDEADKALVRSINEMGHLMSKRTIAECVETDAIRECLRDLGVDYVQGFGVEHPRMLDALNDDGS